MLHTQDIADVQLPIGDLISRVIPLSGIMLHTLAISKPTNRQSAIGNRQSAIDESGPTQRIHGMETEGSHKKANGRDIRGSASRPFIFVVTVLTPATT